MHKPMASAQVRAEVQLLIQDLQSLQTRATRLQRQLRSILDEEPAPRPSIARNRAASTGRARSSRTSRSARTSRSSRTPQQRVTIDLSTRDLSMIAPEIVSKSDDDMFECPVCLDNIRFGDITHRNPSKWDDAMYQMYSFAMTQDCSTHLFCDACFAKLPRNLCAVCRQPLTAEGEIPDAAEEDSGPRNVVMTPFAPNDLPQALQRELGNAVMRIVMTRRA